LPRHSAAAKRIGFRPHRAVPERTEKAIAQLKELGHREVKQESELPRRLQV